MNSRWGLWINGAEGYTCGRRLAMKRNAIAWVMILVALGLFGCGRDRSTISEPVGIQETTEAISGEGIAPGRVVFNVRYVYPSGMLAKVAVVDRMTAYVYEPERLLPIAMAALERVGDRGKASITVAAGDNRRVDLVAYEDTLASWFGQDEDVDVVAGQTTTADITMMPTTPILADLPDTSMTGSYTVSWGGVPGPLGYSLEENGTEVYSGMDLSAAISGKAEGIYSYRVKANVAYGDSPWSDAVSVVVVIPPEEGTIDVDVPWPPPGEVATFTLPGGATMEMVWIEPGTFMMGTTEEQKQLMISQGISWWDWLENELPAHEVTITRGFWIGKYELTQGQWEAVMGTRPWQGMIRIQEGPEYPAALSWDGVQLFIATLNEFEEADVYRLPTEAEWEYACRAGTTTLWSFGDDASLIGEYAWYYYNAECEDCSAHKVGTRLPNPWGLYDVHGNMFELCQDWYDGDYYSISPSVDPQGPTSGTQRILRGGSISNYEAGVRSTYRVRCPPEHSAYDFGARLVRQEPQ
jgi:formylglycine-generating enzyme required for sulfatase activity